MHSRPLLWSLNTLNVYQINLFRYLSFKYNLNKNETPVVFNNLIKKSVHKYPKKFSKNNGSKFCISLQGPKV